MTSDIYPSATVLPQNYMKFEIEIRFHLYYFISIYYLYYSIA